MKISLFYLAFIPLPLIRLWVLFLILFMILYDPEFLYQLQSLFSLYQYLHGSFSSSFVPFPFFYNSFNSFFYSSFNSFLWPIFFSSLFWSFSPCVPNSPVSIRRMGKELHESILFLLPFSTGGGVSVSLFLGSRSFPALVTVPACAFPSVHRIFPPSQHSRSHSSSDCLLVLYLPFFSMLFNQSPLLSSILFARRIWLLTDPPVPTGLAKWAQLLPRQLPAASLSGRLLQSTSFLFLTSFMPFAFWSHFPLSVA